MTTRVVTTIVTPNHPVRFSVQDMHQTDGEWISTDVRDIPVGQTVLLETHITNTRRLVIEEALAVAKAATEDNQQGGA